MTFSLNLGHGELVADGECGNLRFGLVVVVARLVLALFISGEESTVRNGCACSRQCCDAQLANLGGHCHRYRFTGRINHL